MLQQSEQGFFLDNGTQITHGAGAPTKNAFPPELNIPGKLQTFNVGHKTDARTPAFAGPTGCLAFTTETRMPRHVHMDNSSTGSNSKYVVEKIMVLGGVALAELAGEVYVIPPMTMVIIGTGVPHAWAACPAGLDLQKLGISDEQVVSSGQFTAFFEYEKPAAFFPTAQTEKLCDPRDYVGCDDLQSIRFPKMTLDEIVDRAWFVWGRNLSGARKDVLIL